MCFRLYVSISFNLCKEGRFICNPIQDTILILLKPELKFKFILFTLIQLQYNNNKHERSKNRANHTLKYRDLLIVLPMRELSIFRGIAVSLLRSVIGSNVEIDVVALNWVADVRKQIRFAGRKN